MSNADLKQRILLALNDPVWAARTDTEIAKFAGIDEKYVRAVLTADSNLARKWPSPDKDGQPLYIPASRKLTIREILARMQFYLGGYYKQIYSYP